MYFFAARPVDDLAANSQTSAPSNPSTASLSSREAKKEARQTKRKERESKASASRMEDARNCLQMAQSAFDQRDWDATAKYLDKSERCYPLEEVQALRKRLFDVQQQQINELELQSEHKARQEIRLFLADPACALLDSKSKASMQSTDIERLLGFTFCCSVNMLYWAQLARITNITCLNLKARTKRLMFLPFWSMPTVGLTPVAILMQLHLLFKSSGITCLNVYISYVPCLNRVFKLMHALISQSKLNNKSNEYCQLGEALNLQDCCWIIEELRSVRHENSALTFISSLSLSQSSSASERAEPHQRRTQRSGENAGLHSSTSFEASSALGSWIGLLFKLSQLRFKVLIGFRLGVPLNRFFILFSPYLPAFSSHFEHFKVQSLRSLLCLNEWLH